MREYQKRFIHEEKPTLTEYESIREGLREYIDSHSEFDEKHRELIDKYLKHEP